MAGAAATGRIRGRSPRNPTLFARPLLFLLGLFATVAPARADDAAAVLRVQAKAWDSAIARRDRAAIEKNLHPRFFQIDIRGTRNERAAFVAALLGAKLQLDPYTVQELDVRLYGDSALLSGTTQITGRSDGEPSAIPYRYIDTHVREDGEWRVVAVQVTRIVP